MVQGTGQEASWTSHWGGDSGMSILEETPGQTKEALERLYLSASLETTAIIGCFLYREERTEVKRESKFRCS